MRKRLFNLICGSGYSIFMIICIIISIIPLAFRTEIAAFRVVEIVSTCVFVFDYVARWITADIDRSDMKYQFLLYPVQPMAVIDLLSILPSVTAVNSGLKLLKLFRLARMMRMFRVFRAFRLARYSKNVRTIVNVFKAQKESLMTVLILAAAYILVSALVVFNVEPDTFANFFEAVYWATVSLTTMGYGDIYPVTTIGRTVTILSSLLGIAIVALPAGIVTAGYMDELKKEREENGKEKENTDLAPAEADDKSEEEIC